MKRFFFLVGFIGFLLCFIGNANAISFTTYTNQSSWETAVGTFTIEDFNDESNGVFTFRDFGDFTATLYNQNTNNKPQVNDNEIRLQIWDNQSYTRFSFDNPIRALGFDWRNTDESYDKIEMNVQGNDWIFGPSQSSGFFGIVSTDGMFTSADLGDSVGDGGALGYGYLDNFRYASSSATIPEPTTWLLFGTGILGLLGYGRKKFFKKL